MPKRYETFARDSKANASTAYATAPVRVSLLQVNAVTHKSFVASVHTFRPGDFDTLHAGVQATFGVTHGNRDRLVYEVGRG